MSDAVVIEPQTRNPAFICSSGPGRWCRCREKLCNIPSSTATARQYGGTPILALRYCLRPSLPGGAGENSWKLWAKIILTHQADLCRTVQAVQNVTGSCNSRHLNGVDVHKNTHTHPQYGEGVIVSRERCKKQALETAFLRWAATSSFNFPEGFGLG